MVVAHMWVREMVPRLESAITSAGFGVGDRPNQYALVGFGQRLIPQGIVLTQLTSVNGFLNATNNLKTDGIFEDGYSAINVALNEITHRSNSTKIFVLVTDEARQALTTGNSITRDSIERRLREEEIMLNVVVRQGFLYDINNNNTFAFGLTFNRTSFSVDTNSTVGFRTHANGVRHPNPLFNEGSTYKDYVELAFALNGAAWYIDILTRSPAPFSNAFIQVKIDELVLQRRCLQCVCGRECQRTNRVSLNSCTGLISEYIK